MHTVSQTAFNAPWDPAQQPVETKGTAASRTQYPDEISDAVVSWHTLSFLESAWKTPWQHDLSDEQSMIAQCARCALVDGQFEKRKKNPLPNQIEQYHCLVRTARGKAQLVAHVNKDESGNYQMSRLGWKGPDGTLSKLEIPQPTVLAPQRVASVSSATVMSEMLRNDPERESDQLPIHSLNVPSSQLSYRPSSDEAGSDIFHSDPGSTDSANRWMAEAQPMEPAYGSFAPNADNNPRPSPGARRALVAVGYGYTVGEKRQGGTSVQSANKRRKEEPALQTEGVSGGLRVRLSISDNELRTAILEGKRNGQGALKIMRNIRDSGKSIGSDRFNRIYANKKDLVVYEWSGPADNNPYE